MKSIFKWFTLEEDITVVRIAWFADIFEPTEFTGVDRLLAAFIKYCSDLDIPAQKKYFQTYLQTEGKKEVVKYSVRLDTMDKFNYDEPAALEEAYRVIVSTAVNTYDAYSQIDLEGHLFKVDMKAFIEQQKAERVQQVMAQSFPKLQSGAEVDNVVEDIMYRLDKISIVYNVECLETLDFMSGATACKKGKKQSRFLFKTGMPCIDGAMGGVYSKQLHSITAAPGAGKTRFAAVHYAYQAAVVYGIDVLFDELELSAMEVENILIAHHLVNLYKGRIKIPDSLINRDNLTDEQRRYVESARMDLFESGKYGKIVIREESLIIEDFSKRMRTYLKHNKNCALWIVDYAGLAESKPKGKYAKILEEYEIIGELYKKGKKLAKEADIAILVLNQFTKEGVAASAAGKRIIPGHVQGGQIIQRHSDFDVAMTMTEEEEIANMRSLSTVKKRSSAGFQNVPINVDLSVSLFKQMKAETK